MKTKLLVSLCVAAVLAVAIALAQDKGTAKEEAKPDPRIDKLIEQNERILKNQTMIIEKLEGIDKGMLLLKRRSS